MSREFRIKLALFLSFFVALALTAQTWSKVRGRAAWVTAPRRAAWTGPSNEKIWMGAPYATCTPVEGLTSIVDGERVWITCAPGTTTFPNGALVLVDPKENTAAAKWVWEAGTQPKRVERLLFAKDGALAIVTTTVGVGRVAGVAGKDGWIRSPVPLPTGEVFGMFFDEGVLEVAVVETLPEPRAVVVRLAPGAEPEVRDVAKSAIVSVVAPTMMFIRAYRSAAPPSWHFIVQTGSNEYRELGEDGTDVVRLSDGELEYGDFDPDRARFVRDGGRVVRTRLQQVVDGEAFVPFAGRDLVLGRHSVYGDVQLSLEDRTEGIHLREATPTRLFDCADLVTATFLPRATGGFTLVSASGCYASFDADLKRVDPLSIGEHLRSKGSRDLNYDSRWPGLALGFLLLGLPHALLFAIILRRFVGKNRPYFTALVGGYAALGSVLLGLIWPLLR